MALAMAKTKATEFDLLEIFVTEMEQRGVKRNLISFDIDEKMAVAVSDKIGVPVTLEEIQKLADRCLANEWLEHRVMAGKYGQLELTASGFGVVRSRQRKQEMLANRSLMKKTSDYIEDHKGLFIALGVAIGLAGILVRLFVG
jgi:hypothetical protein